MPRTPRVVAAALLLVPALGLAACADDENTNALPGATSTASSSSPNASAAPGAPIKLMTLTSETGPIVFKEVVGAAKAAAKNVNDDGGVQGHPIQVITCDTRFEPNGAADCARKAVSEKVTAVVGSIGPDGDTYVPILKNAGIPTVANLVSSQAEASEDISYPFHGTALQLVAAGAVLKAGGASSVQYLGPNVPAYVGLIELVKQLLPKVGIEFKGSTLYDVSVTDFNQDVAEAYESGADAVNALFTTSQQVPAFLNAVDSGGYSFEKTPTTSFGSTFKPSVLEGQAAGKLNGFYIVNGGQTPTDTSLPDIKRFHDEVGAAGEQIEFNDSALAAWSGVHMIADVLADAGGDVTSPQVLRDALKGAGTINPLGWVPVDYSKPALPAPLSDALPRFASALVWVSKIENNKAVTAVCGPVAFTGPVELSDDCAAAESTGSASPAPTESASTGSSSTASEASASPTPDGSSEAAPR